MCKNTDKALTTQYGYVTMYAGVAYTDKNLGVIYGNLKI